ncbi:class I SAM-dependent methyltransferase [Actinocatenispora sera]|uniref:class I SAM-dependent methyltransferase n=1 Tax=Actinocatenispora sera TaxID=390989 RepID=UPI0033D4902B
MPSTFEDLVAEALAVPVGWDFGWLAGRADEARPWWRYSRLVADRMAVARAALDIQTGAGDLLAALPVVPPRLAATESWPPNVALARERLAPVGGTVAEVADDADLPFDDGSFDLVTCRHPTVLRWPEIARVLAPGGSYLSQQVGAGSVRELTDALMGPQPVSQVRAAARALGGAEAAGLDVVALHQQSLPMRFDDIAAVIVFLRTVVWIVPDFDVERYRGPLLALHDQITAHGPFRATSERFLIEARRPAS